MNYELKNIIISFYLIVNIAASPSQPSMNHEVNPAKQDYPSPEWERELLELRSLAPRQTFNIDRESSGIGGLTKHDWKKNRGKHLKKANVTIDFVDLQPEDMDFPLPRLTTATVNFRSYNNSSNSLENELKGLNKNYSNEKKSKSATKNEDEEEGEGDYDDYEDEDNGDGDDLRENDEWMEPTRTPTAETTSSYDSLVESLTIFLGTPERSSEITSKRSHKSNKEIDFKGLAELDTVRKMGKGANIPQDLVDAVDPEADENLLELMVRIAENPAEWRNVHKAIQRLDQAMLTSDKILSHSYEKKEIGKRSSPYREERKKKQKHAKLRKRKGNYRYADNNNWTKDFPSEKQRKGRKNRTKSHRHRAKNKNKQNELLHPFKSSSSSSSTGKIRHGIYENENSDYGKYSENSINSVIEKLRLNNKNRESPYTFADLKPKSAPFEFNNSENKNFERWKSEKWPEWPKFNNYRPKTISSSTGYETKYHHSRHRDSSLRKKLKEIRRWGLLKQSRKNLLDKWSRSNEIDENNNWKNGKSNVKTVGKEQSKLAEKEKMLAANNWPAPQEQKEKVWPHFSYHRVTSSPSVQQRDAGAQSRHRSAYVAVSVIPSNDTGNNLRKNPPKSEPSQKPNSKNKIHNGYSKNRSLPDLFNQLVDNQTVPDNEKNSLKTIEERFHFKNEDRTRLQQVMRDANSSSNRTILF